MTGTQRLFAAGGFSLLAGITLMITLHWVMSGTLAGVAMDGPWARHMMHVSSGMGWAMVLGPVAMALWFAGVVGLVVGLPRALAKAA